MSGTLSARPALDLLREAMDSPAGRRNPYPCLSELVAREEMVVEEDGRVFVLGYASAAELLRSPAFLKRGTHASSAPPALTSEQVSVLERERVPEPGLLSAIDDPDHRRLRRLLSLAFAPREVAPWRQVIHDSLDEILADLDHRQPVDLVPTLCHRIVGDVVGELIGLPRPDRREFAELARLQSVGRDPGVSFEEHMRAARARREVYDHVARLVDAERADPRDTPVGRLVRLEQQGESISGDELVSLVATVYTTGFGSTARMLGNGIVALLRHPRQAALLAEDQGLAGRVTDEVLRYDTPTMTVAYYAGEGAEVAGRPVSPGALCTVVIGAANHDPRVFEEPEAFDVTRERERPPLSFGTGIHYCLGVALARLEGEVVFSELMRRFPRMRLVEDPPRQDTFRARVFTRLPVVLDPST